MKLSPPHFNLSVALTSARLDASLAQPKPGGKHPGAVSTRLQCLPCYRLLDTSKAGTAAYSAGLATQQAAGNASLAAQALSEGSADAAMQYVEDSKKAAAQAGIFAGQVPQG